MTAISNEAERWEAGSRKDPIRNKFVIPEVVRILEATKPTTILDIGSGTGYVARTIHEQLTCAPRWTLVDMNEARLDVARRHQPESMICEWMSADVMDLPETGRTYDTVLALFTLLEIPDLPSCIKCLHALTGADGRLIIALPDAWVDVIKHADEAEPSALRRFLNKPVSIEKIDKFTGNAYPFRAVRLEQIISQVLAEGFSLTELRQSPTGTGEVFLLTFTRRQEVGHA